MSWQYMAWSTSPYFADYLVSKDRKARQRLLSALAGIQIQVSESDRNIKKWIGAPLKRPQKDLNSSRKNLDNVCINVWKFQNASPWPNSPLLYIWLIISINVHVYSIRNWQKNIKKHPCNVKETSVTTRDCSNNLLLKHGCHALVVKPLCILIEFSVLDLDRVQKPEYEGYTISF